MKINVQLKLQFLILSIFISASSHSQNVLNTPKDKIGISIRSEFVTGELNRSDYIPNTPKSGFGIELGSYYERKLGKRFVFLTEFNFRYREFTMEQIVINNNGGPDYDHSIAIFEIDWKLLTFTPSVGFKIYCCKKPKIYVEIGGGFDYRLNEAPMQEYKTSALYSNSQLVRTEFIGGAISSRRNLVILNSNLYSRVEFGAGIELNKLDIGLFYRREISESIGARIKHSLFSK